MNKEIKQILKNQQAIMIALRELDEISLDTSNNFLMEELGNTNVILNPEQFKDKDGEGPEPEIKEELHKDYEN